MIRIFTGKILFGTADDEHGLVATGQPAGGSGAGQETP